MTEYLNSTIEKYIEDLSKKKITPGGGSASALSAALGAALNLMVINYSLRPGADEKVPEALSEALVKQEESLGSLKRLIDEDCRVFEVLMKALSDGKEAQEEFIKASAAPMEVCRECRDGIEIISSVFEHLNKNLISDVKCAAQIFIGAFYSAKFNVEINLQKIKDVSFVEKTQNELKEIASLLTDFNEKLK